MSIDMDSSRDAEFLRHIDQKIAQWAEEERRSEERRAAEKELVRSRYDPVAARRAYDQRKPSSYINKNVASDGGLRRAMDEIRLNAWFSKDSPRLIEGVAITDERSEHGSRVNILGVVFSLPLPLLLSHDHDKAIGLVYEASVMPGRIDFKAQLANSGLPDCAAAWDDIVSGGSLGVSVSFGQDDAFMQRGVDAHILDSWRWTELSVCRVGAIGGARILRVREANRTIIDLRDTWS